MNNHGQSLHQRIITIRTPENIELAYALAGPGSRAAAYAIDLLIMLALSQIILNLLVFALTFLFSSLGQSSELWVAGIIALASFTLYNGYFIFFEWMLNGQTFGKGLLHIRVIKHGGYALNVFDTLLRNLLRAIDFLPLFYGVGLVSLLLTRDSQRLGDLAAGTLVVYQEPVQNEPLFDDVQAASEVGPVFPTDQFSNIPQEAVSLASHFWNAKSEMGSRARQEIAAGLVGVIRQTSDLEPKPAQSVESFLAAVLKQAEQGPAWSYPDPAQAEFPV